jgi:rod shape-determining protein MreB
VQDSLAVDQDATFELLAPMLHESRWFRGNRPRTIVCAPSTVSAEHRAEVTDCMLRAGAGSVTLVPEPVAAAIGAGIDVGNGRSTFIVDVGEGITDCALIQRGRVVQSVALSVGCSDFRRRLRQCAKQIAHLELCDSEAERLLRRIGFELYPFGKASCTGRRKGKIQEENLPKRALQEALRPALAEILQTIAALLHDLPSTTAVEVIEDGIFLSGGGALLSGFDEQVARVTNVEVRVVADPLGSVIYGAQAMLPFMKEFGFRS